MSARARFETALGGGDCVAFAPLAWSKLPAFVRTPAPEEFWLDVGATQRMLGDAAGICRSDAITVPLLACPGAVAAQAAGAAAGAVAATAAAGAGAARMPASCGEIVRTEEVAAAAVVLERLRAVGEPGLAAELPTLGELAGLFPDEDDEDREDALNDLVRTSVEAGAQAVVLRARTGEDLRRSLEAIAPLATYYGATVLGVGAGRATSYPERCEVGLLERDGTWPELGRGVILSAGDLTKWWTPDDLRGVLAGRREGH